MPFKRGQLRYFVAVADEGQVTRAAAKLNIAQPALSQSIAVLESELGFKLFDRGPRGVTLTPEGTVFYEKARLAIEASDDAVLVAKSLARRSSGVVGFGFVGTPPQIHAPELFSTFSALRPEVSFSYRELTLPSAPTSAWLADVDVALCACPPSDPDIWVQVLRRERRVALVPRTHELAGRRELGVSDVLDETFIGMHPTVAPWWSGYWSLDDHRGGPPPNRTGDAITMPQQLFAAIASGHAITTVPEFQAAVIDKLVPAVATIPIVDADTCELGLMGRRDRLSPSVNALLAAAASIG
jgi:DNA-binding transcriptional LysR family regulator